MNTPQPALDPTMYFTLFHEFPQPLLVIDAQSTAVRDANAAACQHLNLPREHLLTHTLNDLTNAHPGLTASPLPTGDAALTMVQLKTAPAGDVSRVKAFQEALVRLSGSEAFLGGDVQATYERISETAAAVMNVNRVGIWLLDDSQETLICVDQYEASTNQHTTGFILQASHNPAYFEAIRSGRVIDATDARTDPRTAAFTDNYLIPHNIHSLLDAGAIVEGQIAGIICCEQTGRVRRWTSHDYALVGAFADQLAAVLLHARNRATETALLASERRYQNLINNASDIIYTRDLDGNITSINPAGERLLGYSLEEISRLNLRDMMSPARQSTAEQFIRHSQAGQNISTSAEVEVITKDGKRRILEVLTHLEKDHGRAPEVQGVARDITERRELEKQLLQSQKMDALGKLAGGVAHDFNNLLVVILSYSEIALMQLEDDAPLTRYVQRIHKAGQRAAELTRQLLAFSRNDHLENGPTHVNDNITQLQRMLGRVLGETITLQLDLASPRDTIHIDPGQLDQIIMNLVVNARDAMPQGGTITLATHTVEISAPPTDPNLRPGVYLQLTVQDTGDGINDQTLPHIFEPFYTTKPPGKGTGLGLSTVYGLVRQANGTIHVDSTPGAGTRFDLFLPLLDADQSPTDAQPTELTAQAEQHITILVVEDDTAVCQLIQEALETHGYTVMATADPLEALDWCENHPDRIDVLLTDVIMPAMSGSQLAEQARPLRPDMQVVFMSGHTGDYLDTTTAVTDPTIKLIRKPFTPNSLVARLQDLFEEDGE